MSRTLGTKTYFLDQESSMLYGACEVTACCMCATGRMSSNKSHQTDAISKQHFKRDATVWVAICVLQRMTA